MCCTVRCHGCVRSRLPWRCCIDSIEAREEAVVPQSKLCSGLAVVSSFKGTRGKKNRRAHHHSSDGASKREAIKGRSRRGQSVRVLIAVGRQQQVLGRDQLNGGAQWRADTYSTIIKPHFREGTPSKPHCPPGRASGLAFLLMTSQLFHL